MSGACSPADLMDCIAGVWPARGGGSFKASVNKVAAEVSRYLAAERRQPMKPSRVEDIWRGEVTPRWWEMDALRRAASGDKIVREAKHEISQLDARIARLEALLVQDAEFHSPEADALRTVDLRPHRPVDR